MTTIDNTDVNPFEALKPNDVLTVFDIEWDDDGDEVDLPQTLAVTLPDDFEPSEYHPRDFGLFVDDLLSNDTDYCVIDYGRIEHNGVLICQ